MKNLKKILMALVLVALLVSSVVTIAVAEASYAGDVATAEQLLDTAYEAKAESDSKVTWADAKAPALKSLYKYLITVNPQDEGYDEVKAAYNDMTFKVMNAYFEEYGKAKTDDERSAVLAKVYTYKNEAPVVLGNDSDVVYSSAYVCENCGESAEFKSFEFFNGLAADLKCPGTCTDAECVIAYSKDAAKSFSYVEFEKEFNSTALSVIEKLAAYLFSLEEIESDSFASYYDLLNARQGVAEFVKQYLELEYVAPESALYTGSVAAVADMLTGVTTSSDFDALKTALASAYGYLVENPVNPTTDEYFVFITKYDKLSDALILALTANVDAATTPEAKFAELLSFRDYLVGEGGTQISEKVVKAYNSLRIEVISKYGAADSIVDSLTELDVTVAIPKYTDDLSAFEEKIAAIESAIEAGEDITELVEDVFVNCVSAFAYDPNAEGYAELIRKYIAICDSFVAENFVEPIGASDLVSEQFELLVSFYRFATEYPLCESVIDAYNEIRSELLAKLDAYVSIFAEIELPVYVAPEIKPTTASPAILDSLLQILNSSINAYNTSDTPELKATALEDMKRAAKELHTYVLGVDVDLNAEGYVDYYATFVVNYNEARNNVVNVLLDTVASAESDKVVDALEAVAGFLTEVPLNLSAIDTYNAKVDELVTVTDVASELKLTVAYHEVKAMIAEIMATDDVDELRALAVELYAYGTAGLDVTDSAYSATMADCKAAYEKIAVAIYNDIIASLNKADAETAEELVYDYLYFLEDVYVESVISKTVEALTVVNLDFAQHSLEISKSNEEAAEIETFYGFVASLVAQFDSAASLSERYVSVYTLYELINNHLFKTAFICGDSYAQIIEEYNRVILAFENEIVELLTTDAAAYEFATNLATVREFLEFLPFSEKAISSYNEAYASASLTDFGQYVENIDVECPAIDKYVTPEGWRSALTRINIALDGSVDENGINKSYFNVAYVILSGKHGVAGPQVIDFGVEGFIETITSFDTVKQEIINGYNQLLKAATTPENKLVVLEDLNKFIKDYPFSKDLVIAYNNIRTEIRDAYSQKSNSTFTIFQALVDRIYAQLESCPIDVKYLTDYQKNIYSIGESLLAAAEFSIVENYLDIAMGIGGENALIYQNIAVDELNSSIGSFSLGDFNEQLLAKSNLKFAFVKYLEMLDAEISSLTAEEKENRIKSTGAYIVSKNYPAELISIYNIKYNVSYSAATIAAPTDEGNLYDYAAKLEKVMKATGSANARVALDDLVAYVNGHEFSTENTSGQMVEKLAEVKAALAEATQAQIDMLDKLVSSEESKYPIIFNYDFDTTGSTYKPASTYGTYGSATATVVTAPGTSNKVLRFSTDGAPQFNNKISSAANGLVLDFDIMAPVGEKLNMNMYFYGDSKQYIPFKFTDGVLQDIETYSNVSAGATPIKLTPGEWMHLTIVIDWQKGSQELLVDYVSLGTKSITVPQARLEGGAALRVCPNKSTVYIDNWNIYQGTAYRTLGKLSTMDDDDKFALYMDTLLNEDAKSTERLAAYYSAQNLKAFVTDKSAELKARLESFDITDIKAEAEATHLAKIKELVDKVDVDNITTENTATAQGHMTAANAYIEANRLYVDQMSPEFRSYNQTLIDAADKIEWLANLAKYIEVIKKFHRATSYASLTKHLENVVQYYELCELDDYDKMVMAEKDPVASAFVAEMLKDESVIALVPNITFAAYFYDYIPARLEAQIRYENSVKVVDCIEFIDALVENKDQLTADAYKAALIEAAEQNFDYVDSYIAIIRKIVESEEYEADYEGFAHAIEVFDILNPIFFEALQNKHFEVIKAQLEKYAQTDSYIERAGICTFLNNYIDENEVDMSSEEGMKYIYALQIYEEELEGYMKDYESILAENTESFLGIVQKMQAYVTYSELKPLYEEAIAKYYYNMNVDSEEVKAAVAIFAEYEAKIVAWEENSALFLGYAKTLNSANRMAQKYRALVRCSNYVDGADEGVEGVAAALELYARKLAEYNASIEPTIKEAADASNIVSALRTNRLSATVLAIANAIINK